MTQSRRTVTPVDEAAAAPANGWAREGWLGTLEQPGYRAGPVVARLDEFNELARNDLYLDVLLLDAQGHVVDNDSGPCPALPRERPVEHRSRHVCLVAELVRHAPDTAASLASFAPAMALIREYGVAVPILSIAAQLLDTACSERAVTLGLHHMLVLSLGDEDAEMTVSRLLTTLDDEQRHTAQSTHATGLRSADTFGSPAFGQLARLVRGVGKDRARRFLRHATDFPMVPTPDMFGV